MASYKNLLPSYKASTSLSSPGQEFFDWSTGFAQSALESIPELIGIHPSRSTVKFRQDNPVAGFVSELAGFAVPYTGWFKATKAIKPFARVLEGIGDLQKRPFVTGAAREIARYAPFEVGRLATSQVAGDEDFGSMFGDTALSLATAGGLGGLFSGIASAGARTAGKHALIPGVDIALPTQLQIRQISKMLADPATDPALQEKLGFKLASLRKDARAETLGADGNYLGPLEGDTPQGSLRKQLNRLFKNDMEADRFGVKSVLRKRFLESSSDFKVPNAWKGEAAAAGLPENFEDLGQFYRHISFNPGGAKAKAKATEFDNLFGKLESVGDNTFLSKEADDGLYVVAKKVQGQPGKGHVDDKWVLFKTDDPTPFAKTPAKWVGSVVKENKWNTAGEIAADGGDVYNTVAGFVRNFPLHNYMQLSKPGVLERLLPKKVQGPANELVARLGDAVREYVAPAIHQFKKSPRANWIWNAARATYDSAETAAQQLLYGVQKANPAKSIFSQAMRNSYEISNFGSIKQILDPLSEEDIKGIHYLWRNQVPVDKVGEAVKAGHVSPAAAQAAQQLDTVEGKLYADLVKAQTAAGVRTAKELKGHYGLSRSWEGDSRVAVRDEGGRVVAIASGPNRKAALSNAADIAGENPTWQVAEEYNISDATKIPNDLQVHGSQPGFLLERQNVRGFQWDKTPFTKEELLKAYVKSVGDRTKYQAKLSVDHILQPHVDLVAKEDPITHRMLTARLNDLAGLQSPFSKIQNQIADKVLAPVLGNNSATKIVALTNTTMWNLQLGALKASYPIMNAITFTQTVMPEVAFVLHAQPESVAGRYSYFAMGGTKGPVGGMGVLSPIKMMIQSFREMRKPDAGLTEGFERAVNERVIDPKLVEEYIGESATKLTDLRSAFSSGKGFVEWLRGVSEFLPAHSERLSRAHAFTVGHMLARDHLGLQGEQLYRFAKQFTENTMYMYSSADRPRVFTTPAGSMFGLFKNWMMNYMATMLEYTQEGLSHGNWSPLLWQTAGTGVIGGLAATPLGLAADAFSRVFTDKSMLQKSYDEWGGGDALMFGLPAALTGVSLYSQVASPAANPIRDANMLFGIASLDRVGAVAKTLGYAWDHWQATGEHPGRDPRVREQLIRSFAPVTLYRLMSAFEDEKIKSLSSGYPITDKMSVGDRVLFAAGFNPTGYEKEMAVANELFEKREAKRAAISRLGEAWAQAQLSKDGRQMSEIIRQGIVLGLDTSSIIKSGMARIGKTKESTLNRNFKPTDLAGYSDVLE